MEYQHLRANAACAYSYEYDIKGKSYSGYDVQIKRMSSEGFGIIVTLSHRTITDHANNEDSVC